MPSLRTKPCTAELAGSATPSVLVGTTTDPTMMNTRAHNMRAARRFPVSTSSPSSPPAESCSVMFYTDGVLGVGTARSASRLNASKIGATSSALPVGTV